MKVLFFVLMAALPYIQAQVDYLKPYEVLLYSKESSVDFSKPICFGNILQSHIILTAASCLTSDLETSTINDLNNLTIAVPRENGEENLLFSINNIYTYPKSKPGSENDVALLNLSTSLPLSDRNDIEWIVLSDHPVNLENCIGSDTEDIDVITSYDKKRNLKGYGTLCESELVAILTAALPDKNELSAEYEENIYDDADVKYTEIFPYLWWIFEILQKEELEDIASNNFNPSLPYRERKTANIVHNVTSEDNDNESEELLNSETEIGGIVFNNNSGGIPELKNADMVLDELVPVSSSEPSSKQERDTFDLGLYNTSSDLLKSTAIRINMSDLYLWMLLIWISFLQCLTL